MSDFRKFMPVRILETIIVLTVLLFCLIFVAGFFPYSHPKLTDFVSDRISKIGFDSCFVGDVAVTPWRGVELKEFFFKKKIDGERGLSFHFRKIKISGNIISFYLNRNSLKTTFLKPDSLLFDRIFNQPQQVIKELTQLVSISGEMKRISFDGVNFSITNGDEFRISSGNYSGNVNKMGFKGDKKWNIDLESDRISLNKQFSLKRLKCELSYDDGMATISKCKWALYGGKAKLTAMVDMDRNFLKDARVTVADMDLHNCYSDLDKKAGGSINGKADAVIDFKPGVFVFDSLRGRGTVDVTDFVAEDLPLQRSLETLLFPELRLLQFRKIHSDIDFKGFKNFETNTSGNGSVMDFKASGSAGIDGALNQSFDGTFTAETVGKMPGLVSNSLEKTDNNGRAFHCRIYGTFDYPKIELDQKIMKKAVQNIFEDVKINFKKFFR